MTKPNLDKFKNLLIKEKGRLEKELAQFAIPNPHNPEDFNANFPQFGDKDDENAAEVATYTDNLTLEKTLEKDLQDIENALKRLDEGTYGICKYCEKPIEGKRLLARPASTSCVKCKKMLTQEV